MRASTLIVFAVAVAALIYLGFKMERGKADEAALSETPYALSLSANRSALITSPLIA